MAKLTELARKRPPKQFEPLNLEELENASNMRGFVDFLTERPQPLEKPRPAQGSEIQPAISSPLSCVPPTVVPLISVPPISVPAAKTQLPSIPNTSVTHRNDRHASEAPTSGTHISNSARPQAGQPPYIEPSKDQSLGRSLPESASLESPLLESTLPTGDPLIGASLEQVSLHRSNQPKVRPTRTAADGHSLSEQRLYDFLWQHAVPETAETRRISASYGAIGEALEMHWTNIKRNLISLIDKLAVEFLEGHHTTTQGTTYRLYSPAATFERRRKAGLLWVQRGKGVRFVPAPADPALGANGL